MRVISWNLNGLLSTVKGGAFSLIEAKQPDILCLQEIRTQQEMVVLEGYHHIWNHCNRDGYAGTAMLCREPPIRSWCGFSEDAVDQEGRLIVAEYPAFYLLNAYVPNSQQNLQRHEYRMQWDEQLRDLVVELKEVKSVIICGDFNVARDHLDIYPENMRQYWAEQGYASDERSNFETLLECGLIDAFRELHPNERSYTWWSNRLNKRQQDRGWRLDYFLVDEALMGAVTSVCHLSDILGSDHCPIELEVHL